LFASAPFEGSKSTRRISARCISPETITHGRFPRLRLAGLFPFDERSFALQLAVQEGDRIAAAVAFYAVGYMPDDYAGLHAPVLVHIADDDQ
jgi:hypothetical protein